MTVRFWVGWAIAAEWGHGFRRWGHRVARAPPDGAAPGGPGV